MGRILMKKIIFFNCHQIGDLCHSRGLMNWIVEHMSDNIEVHVVHERVYNVCTNDKIKKSLLKSNGDGTYFTDFNWMIGRRDKTIFYVSLDNDLIINTWIASEPSIELYGLSAETIHEQTINIIDIINSRFDEKIPYPSVVDTIPKLHTHVLKKDQADSLVSKISSYRKKVLLCNGTVHSN